MPSLPFLCLGNGSYSLPWPFIALFWIIVIGYYVVPVLLIAFCILFPIVYWLRHSQGANPAPEATPPLDDHDDPRVARVHDSLRHLSTNGTLAAERSAHPVNTEARPRAPLPEVRRGWW